MSLGKTGNIFVIYTPGCFGSTIEYMLRAYTSFPISVGDSLPMGDGSMHSFNKMLHNPTFDQVVNIQNKKISPLIITPITVTETQHANEITNFYKNIVTSNDTICWLSAETREEMEILLLFMYEKIVIPMQNGNICKLFPVDDVLNVKKWNSKIDNFFDLDIWEQREYLSLSIPSWIEEWVNECIHYKSLKDHLFFSTNEIYNNPISIVEKIAKDYGLDILKFNEMKIFTLKWKDKQKPIFEQYSIIKNILLEIENANSNFSWDPQNLIWESLLQSNLKRIGYELQCYNLNTFPTNIVELKKILITSQNNV